MEARERVVAWGRESLANIRKGKWWLVITPIVVWFVSGLIEHRLFYSTNTFVDEHAPAFLARIKPFVTFGSLGFAAVGLATVIFILVTRAYFKSGAPSQNIPRLFLEFSNAVAAQYVMTFSGLMLKNDGARAFNVEFEPEIRGTYTLKMDNPTKSIDRGEEYAINLRTCKVLKKVLNPIGGMLSSQVETLFERLAGEGEAENGFTVVIKCLDYEKKPFEARSILRWDRWTKDIRCERA